MIRGKKLMQNHFNLTVVADPEPDPFLFGQPDPDPGSKKSAKISENVHKNQPKSLEYHVFFFQNYQNYVY